MLSRFVKVSPVYRKWFDFPGVLVHLRSEITDSPGVWGLLLLAGKCSYRFVSGFWPAADRFLSNILL